MADISETKTLSFNPYSAGNCSGSCVDSCNTLPTKGGFNPYSAGNCSGSVSLVFYWLEISSVSILILLEIALEVLVCLAVDSPFCQVSILILLEIALEDVRSCGCTNCAFGRFQSLFCWKLLWKQRWSSKRPPRALVSILILLEIALEEWLKVGEWLEGKSFNPYSAGNCSGRVRAHGNGNGYGNVSILILLEIALEDWWIFCLVVGQLKFQSLFCWKLLWKKLVVVNTDCLNGVFQSLFCWKLLWKHQYKSMFGV